MNPIVRKDALECLNSAISIIKGNDYPSMQLKILSDRTIHNSSVFQDACSISTTVLIYALAKLYERLPKNKVPPRIVALLEQSAASISKNDDKGFEQAAKQLFAEIKKTDLKVHNFVHRVMEHAEAKKGCNLCRHGLSAGKAAEIIGISQWDLLSYLGKARAADESTEIVSVRDRLKRARSVFS